MGTNSDNVMFKFKETLNLLNNSIEVYNADKNSKFLSGLVQNRIKQFYK